MAFDPDKYNSVSTFDPDKYNQKTSFDPDKYNAEKPAFDPAKYISDNTEPQVVQAIKTDSLQGMRGSYDLMTAGAASLPPVPKTDMTTGMLGGYNYVMGSSGTGGAGADVVSSKTAKAISTAYKETKSLIEDIPAIASVIKQDVKDTFSLAGNNDLHMTERVLSPLYRIGGVAATVIPGVTRKEMVAEAEKLEKDISGLGGVYTQVGGDALAGIIELKALQGLFNVATKGINAGSKLPAIANVIDKMGESKFAENSPRLYKALMGAGKDILAGIPTFATMDMLQSIDNGDSFKDTVKSAAKAGAFGAMVAGAFSLASSLDTKMMVDRLRVDATKGIADRTRATASNRARDMMANNPKMSYNEAYSKALKLGEGEIRWEYDKLDNDIANFEADLINLKQGKLLKEGQEKMNGTYKSIVRGVRYGYNRGKAVEKGPENLKTRIGKPPAEGKGAVESNWRNRDLTDTQLIKEGYKVRQQKLKLERKHLNSKDLATRNNAKSVIREITSTSPKEFAEAWARDNKYEINTVVIERVSASDKPPITRPAETKSASPYTVTETTAAQKLDFKKITSRNNISSNKIEDMSKRIFNKPFLELTPTEFVSLTSYTKRLTEQSAGTLYGKQSTTENNPTDKANAEDLLSTLPSKAVIEDELGVKYIVISQTLDKEGNAQAGKLAELDADNKPTGVVLPFSDASTVEKMAHSKILSKKSHVRKGAVEFKVDKATQVETIARQSGTEENDVDIKAQFKDMLSGIETVETTKKPSTIKEHLKTETVMGDTVKKGIPVTDDNLVFGSDFEIEASFKHPVFAFKLKDGTIIADDAWRIHAHGIKDLDEMVKYSTKKGDLESAKSFQDILDNLQESGFLYKGEYNTKIYEGGGKGGTAESFYNKQTTTTTTTTEQTTTNKNAFASDDRHVSNAERKRTRIRNEEMFGGWDNRSLRVVLNKVIDYGTEFEALVAKELLKQKDLGDNFEWYALLRYTNHQGEWAPFGGGSVRVNPYVATEKIPHVIIHEAMHDILRRKYPLLTNIQKERLRNLYLIANRKLNDSNKTENYSKNIIYGATHEHEFFDMAITNQEFQHFLASIPYKSEYKNFTFPNVWEAFKAFIKSLFGEEDTLLKATIDIVLDMTAIEGTASSKQLEAESYLPSESSINKNAKDSVFIGKLTTNPVKSMPKEVIVVTSPIGTLYTTNAAKAEQFRNDASQESIANILGFSKTKKQVMESGKTPFIVSAKDKEGNHIYDELTDEPEVIMEKYKQRGYNAETMTPEQLQKHRQTVVAVKESKKKPTKVKTARATTEQKKIIRQIVKNALITKEHGEWLAKKATGVKNTRDMSYEQASVFLNVLTKYAQSLGKHVFKEGTAVARKVSTLDNRLKNSIAKSIRLQEREAAKGRKYNHVSQRLKLMPERLAHSFFEDQTGITISSLTRQMRDNSRIATHTMKNEIVKVLAGFPATDVFNNKQNKVAAKIVAKMLRKMTVQSNERIALFLWSIESREKVIPLMSQEELAFAERFEYLLQEGVIAKARMQEVLRLWLNGDAPGDVSQFSKEDIDTLIEHAKEAKFNNMLDVYSDKLFDQGIRFGLRDMYYPSETSQDDMSDFFMNKASSTGSKTKDTTAVPPQMIGDNSRSRTAKDTKMKLGSVFENISKAAQSVAARNAIVNDIETMFGRLNNSKQVHGIELSPSDLAYFKYVTGIYALKPQIQGDFSKALREIIGWMWISYYSVVNLTTSTAAVLRNGLQMFAQAGSTLNICKNVSETFRQLHHKLSDGTEKYSPELKKAQDTYLSAVVQQRQDISQDAMATTSDKISVANKGMEKAYYLVKGILSQSGGTFLAIDTLERSITWSSVWQVSYNAAVAYGKDGNLQKFLNATKVDTMMADAMQREAYTLLDSGTPEELATFIAETAVLDTYMGYGIAERSYYEKDADRRLIIGLYTYARGAYDNWTKRALRPIFKGAATGDISMIRHGCMNLAALIIMGAICDRILALFGLSPAYGVFNLFKYTFLNPVASDIIDVTDQNAYTVDKYIRGEITYNQALESVTRTTFNATTRYIPLPTKGMKQAIKIKAPKKPSKGSPFKNAFKKTSGKDPFANKFK